MVKTTKKKVFDTETATIVEKKTHGVYGDPAGYEMTMYRTPEGDFFLYTYGGTESPYKVEKIAGYTKARAADWMNK